jgi:hypothetical protein
MTFTAPMDAPSSRKLVGVTALKAKMLVAA